MELRQFSAQFQNKALHFYARIILAVSRDKINKNRHLTFQHTSILKIIKMEHVFAKNIGLTKHSTNKKFYFVDVCCGGSA